jgi:predicted DNA-binding WGR domain protein
VPRYEFVEGNSSKFWEISLEGTSFTTTYGRLGTPGQSSMKEYDTSEKAQKEYDKLILEKTKKGYRLVDGAGEGTSAPSATASAADKPAASPKGSAAAQKQDKPAAKAAASAKKNPFEDEGDDDDGDDDRDDAGPGQDEVRAASAASSSEKKAGVRRFEFVEGNSSKFWEIELSDTSFTTTYGRLGTSGQSSMKEYDTAAKAKKEYDKLVAEKVKKGYVET